MAECFAGFVMISLMFLIFCRILEACGVGGRPQGPAERDENGAPIGSDGQPLIAPRPAARGGSDTVRSYKQRREKGMAGSQRPSVAGSEQGAAANALGSVAASSGAGAAAAGVADNNAPAANSVDNSTAVNSVDNAPAASSVDNAPADSSVDQAPAASSVDNAPADTSVDNASAEVTADGGAAATADGGAAVTADGEAAKKPDDIVEEAY